MAAKMQEEHLERPTIQAYTSAVWQFYLWTKTNVGTPGRYPNPRYLGREEIERFLTAEARRGVAASTQNVKFSAIMYLYGKVLGIKLENVNALRAKTPKLSADDRAAP